MKRILKVVGLVVLAILVLAGAGIGFIGWKANANLTRKWDIEPPKITRATSPEALARGEAIFTSICSECHLDDERQIARGRHMIDIPAFLGTFHTANITRPVLDAYSDEELARVIRVGIRRDDTVLRAPMPRFDKMSDDDVAAVIGYLRTDSPWLAANDTVRPRPELSFIGKIIQLQTYPPTPDGAKSGITAPPKGATVAYGEYMANSIYQCWDCHTAGFGAGKMHQPGFYGGGFELADGELKQIFSTNITFSEQGIGGWTLDDFANAVRNGVHKDGTILRYPMPRWRLIDDTEMAAIYAYLQTVPKSDKVNQPGQARPREKAPPPDAKPEQMFASLGCVTCHAKGAPYHARFKDAATKEPEWIAQWIRNPEKTKPNTQMPTFEAVLTEEQALALAMWVKAEAAKQ